MRRLTNGIDLAIGRSSLFSTSGTALSAPARHAFTHRIVFAGATDKGLERSHNEDRYGTFPDLGLFIVADGMGGAAAGDVAARMAVEVICRAVVEATATGTQPPAGRAALTVVTTAIERANQCVNEAAQRVPGCRGMGTTVAAVLARGDLAVLAHVGDSRIYRLRDRHLELLTEDHSLFNDFVRHGLADPDHPERFPHRNVISRAVGTKPTVEVEARLVEAAPGDALLLCSDGLSGVVPHAELAAALLAHTNPDEAVAALIRRANELGGPDNITAVLVTWDAAGAPRSTRG